MNSRIKVIKFAEREHRVNARIANRPVAGSHVAEVIAHDAAGTIIGWIHEMQHKKQLNFKVARALLSSSR